MFNKHEYDTECETKQPRLMLSSNDKQRQHNEKRGNKNTHNFLCYAALEKSMTCDNTEHNKLANYASNRKTDGQSSFTFFTAIQNQNVITNY